MPILNTRGNASATGFGFTSGGDSRVLLSSNPGPSATISTYSGYIVFKFTATGTLNVGAGAPGTADVFVVAGGESGGSPPVSFTGGAGGARSASPAFTITANTPIPVVVGGTATNSTFGSVTSSGGTAGGSPGPTAQINFSPGNGGDGPSNTYETGSSQAYGGGGGGGQVTPGPTSGGTFGGGAGGQSGGGGGGSSGYQSPKIVGAGSAPGTPGGAGAANTGGGGGGGGNSPSPYPPTVGGTGGSGLVIARFPTASFRTS